MAFQLEKDMTTVIKNNLMDFIKEIKKECKQDQYIYACEVPVYYRMIDITIAMYCHEYNDFDDCQYYERTIRNLSSKCFAILTFISAKGKASISFLEKSLLIEKKELIKCLDKLCKTSLIEKVSKYSYGLKEWSIILPKELIAVELKLAKWQEALEQGVFNQRFAEYSFVVLDEDRVKNNEKIINAYKESNVGLMYLNKSGSIDTIFIPKRNNKIDMYESQFHKIKILKDFITNSDKWNQIP